MLVQVQVEGAILHVEHMFMHTLSCGSMTRSMLKTQNSLNKSCSMRQKPVK